MRIFEHRIFLSLLAGKICHNWTDVTYRMNKQKWRMRNYSARIFQSFLAGKLKMFKLPITRVEPTKKPSK